MWKVVIMLLRMSKVQGHFASVLSHKNVKQDHRREYRTDWQTPMASLEQRVCLELDQLQARWVSQAP